MQDILTREGPLKQGDFRKVIGDKLEMKKNRILKLFKRGTGTFWSVERREKNSMLFSSYPVFPLTKVAENRKTESGGIFGKEKHSNDKSTQNVMLKSLPVFQKA